MHLPQKTRHRRPTPREKRDDARRISATKPRRTQRRLLIRKLDLRNAAPGRRLPAPAAAEGRVGSYLGRRPPARARVGAGVGRDPAKNTCGAPRRETEARDGSQPSGADSGADYSARRRFRKRRNFATPSSGRLCVPIVAGAPNRRGHVSAGSRPDPRRLGADLLKCGGATSRQPRRLGPAEIASTSAPSSRMRRKGATAAEPKGPNRTYVARGAIFGGAKSTAPAPRANFGGFDKASRQRLRRRGATRPAEQPLAPTKGIAKLPCSRRRGGRPPRPRQSKAQGPDATPGRA